MNDIMIDLETLGTCNNSAILTIGACRFDIETGEIGQTFQIGIEPENNLDYGEIDPQTVLWWMVQTVSAKAEILNTLRDNAEPIDVALDMMSEVLKISNDSIMWSNGATFDLVILRSAYKRTKSICPWEYWQERDVRTIVDLGRRLHDFDPKKQMPFVGTEHNALDDAVHQAKYVSAIYNKLKNGGIGE